jgi:predicted nucleotidyltransferase component of viral defense system
MMTKKLNSKYIEQAATLIEVIPLIAQNKNFALKGGTAINMFLLDLPRLSVDIDLCYVPLTPRDHALGEISSFVDELSRKLNDVGFKSIDIKKSDGYETTLFVRSKTTEVKIEVNRVVRGAVYNPTTRSLVSNAVELFKRNVEVLCLDINDLFGGKICAALDRQHPRDLFDMHMFLKDFSYTRELHQTFIVYLLSSKKQFNGMTAFEISCENLEDVREKIIELTSTFFNDDEKEFLLSFKAGQPKWELFPVEKVKVFPSIQWKLHNILSMDPKKRRESLKKLEEKLR